MKWPEYGYPSVLIRTGRAAVAYALREASRIATVRRLKRNTRGLHAVLDSMEDGVVLDRCFGCARTLEYAGRGYAPGA